MKLNKFKTIIACTALVAICVVGCAKKETNSDEVTTTSSTAQTEQGTQSTQDETTGTASDIFTKYDLMSDWDADLATYITLGSEDVSITEEGTYVISGTLADGQIKVNVSDTEKVQIVLNGANITCSDSAAIFVENADKVDITLAEGTTNTLTDGGDADTSDADGCIYSKDDLTINGSGTLIVNGNVNNGIDCNNDVKIVSGNITITAVNNGIKAKQSISIKDCTMTITADDAIKATDKNDTSVGTFYMEGGNITLIAEDDGITATVSVNITGGTIDVSDVKDKNVNCDGTEQVVTGTFVL